MAEVSGRVQGVRKNEQYGLYSVKIDGTWYGSGKVNPEVEEGDIVSGEYFTNDKGYKTLKGKLKKGATAPPAAKAPAGASGGGDSDKMSKGEWAAKDQRIQYQHAQKVAAALIANPAILAAAGLDKAKPADKMGIIEGLFDKYTASVFEDVATFGAVARATGAVSEDDKAAPPNDEDDE